MERFTEDEFKAGVGLGQEYLIKDDTSSVEIVKIVQPLEYGTVIQYNNPLALNTGDTLEVDLSETGTLVLTADSVTVLSGSVIVYSGIFKVK